MSENLPEPTDADVWGEILNEVIEAVDSKAESAAAAAATNVAVDETDTSGTLTLTYGANSVAVLPASLRGASNGVAPLDGSGNVPLEHLGLLGFQDVGAAAAEHQHSPGDLPQVALAVDVAPAIALFDTVSEQWPLRTAVTDSPTRTVIWMGDADIPTYAIPDVDLFYGPRRTGATTETPDPPDEPTATPDANGVTLAEPVVTVSGSAYNISANVTTTSNMTFRYLQLAVRGPDGGNYDTAHGTFVNVNTTTLEITGSGNAGLVGDWTVRLAYNLTGGPTDWIDGPAETFTIAATGGVPGGTIPVLGRSALPWNSGVFYNAGSVTSATEFFNWRNRPGDAIMYFTGRTTWNDLNWLRDDLTGWPGYRIVSLPSQPSGQSNAATAAGSNNAFWVQYGLNLKNKGWDDGRTIIRLNWEANGNWYSWAWMFGGPAQYVNAYKNVVNSIRTHAPKTKFTMNMNRGNNYDGTNWQTQIMDPLIGYVDIVGIDSYDHAPAQNTESSWTSTLTQNPGLTSVATYCRAKGLKMSLDEWGASRGVSGSYTGGGDNPFYMNKMWEWFNANDDVCALEYYFNDRGAPDVLRHKILPPDDNPNASAAYKATSRWGRA